MGNIVQRAQGCEFSRGLIESLFCQGDTPLRTEGHNPVNNKISLAKEVAWASQNMPRTLRQVAALPDLSHVRLACCMHLDMKMIPLVQGILEKGAKVFLTTCNPTTVQDDVVAWLVERGAEACAWRNMSDADWQQSWEKAIAWGPTHLCEMGADITTLLHQRGEFGHIVAGLEATGSGVNRLGDIQPGYPIFNWDDLPVKEGLHNRHMVGLTAWHTFFQTTHLTLHEKKVLVIGYGLVGQGVAAAAKAFGGQVMVAEIDPARRLQAAYDGWADAFEALLRREESDWPRFYDAVRKMAALPAAQRLFRRNVALAHLGDMGVVGAKTDGLAHPRHGGETDDGAGFGRLRPGPDRGPTDPPAMNAALPFMDGEMRGFAARTLSKVEAMTEAEFAGLPIYAADEV